MAESIFDLGEVFSLGQHVHCTGMAETVGRAQGFEAFFRQCYCEMPVAHAVDAVSSQSLAALIDKQPVLVKGSGCCAISVDVKGDQFDGLWEEADLAISVSFAENGEGIVVGIQIVGLQPIFRKGFYKTLVIKGFRDSSELV